MIYHSPLKLQSITNFINHKFILRTVFAGAETTNMQDYVEVTKQGLNPGLYIFYAGANSLPLHKENYEITDGIFKYNRITET